MSFEIFYVPEASHITPAPSVEAQFSRFVWIQSRILVSSPLHSTSSIIKSLETGPKADLTVATEFVGSNPSILQITLASNVSQ